MKYQFFAVFSLLVVIGSCKQSQDYAVEIRYTVSGLKGDSILTNRQSYFVAKNDSLAYLIGAKDFENACLQKPDSIGRPTKFSVQNKTGKIVLPPFGVK